MKKSSISILLVVIVLGLILGGCAAGDNDADVGEMQPVEDNDAEVGEMQTLKAAVDMQTAHGSVFIVADAKGFLEKHGLVAEYTHYPHGIAAMEALPTGTWEVLTTAFPGWTPGSLNHDLTVIGVANWEQYDIGFFARPDSPIVEDGKGNIDGYPELFGTPETWKGSEILLPTGTTLHLTLSATLNALGLTEDDVEIINMDVPSAYTAFKAGNGDLAGQWTNFSQESWKDGLVMVAHQDSVFVRIPTIFVASAPAIQNNSDVVLKALLAYFETWDWMIENMEESAQIVSEYHIEQGFDMDVETALNVLGTATVMTFEDQLEMFTSGELQQIGKDTFDFFASIGRYDAEEWEKTLKKNFDQSFIEKAVNK